MAKAVEPLHCARVKIDSRGHCARVKIDSRGPWPMEKCVTFESHMRYRAKMLFSKLRGRGQWKKPAGVTGPAPKMLVRLNY